MSKSNKARLTVRINASQAKKPSNEDRLTASEQTTHIPLDSSPLQLPNIDIPPQEGSLAVEEDFHDTRIRSRQLLDEWIHEEKDLSETSSTLYSPYFEDSPYPIVIEEESRTRRKSFISKIPIFKYVTSVGGAIVTGALMGMLLLTFFVDDGNFSAVGIPSKEDSREQSGSGANKDQDGATTPVSENVFQIPVQLPSQPYYMIQAGVFSDEERGKQMIQQLGQLGYRGILLPTSTDFRVYLAVTGTKEDASVVASYFKEQNVEAYVKPFAIPSVNRMYMSTQDADPAAIVLFVQEGEALLQQISALQTQIISGLTPTADLTGIKQSMTRWANSTEKFRSNLPATSQSQLDLMIKHMEEAVASQLKYQENGSLDLIWGSQMHLMEYAVSAQRWVQGLAQTR